MSAETKSVLIGFSFILISMLALFAYCQHILRS